MSNNKQQKPHGFCETPEQKCTSNYCDENGCQNRKRNLVDPIESSNNKHQSAVEWFHKKTWNLKIQLELGEISIGEYASTYATLYEQAKEMEKKQIINAFIIGTDSYYDIRPANGEQYYNETHGGTKQ